MSKGFTPLEKVNPVSSVRKGFSNGLRERNYLTGFTPLENLSAMFPTRVSQSKNDGRWHTGHTKDLRKRFNEHNPGIIFSPINNSKRFLSLTGFTLVELLMVVIIIGIMISLAIPSFTTATERSRAAEGVGILGAIRGAQLRYFAENGTYCNGSGCSLDSDFTALQFFNAPALFASAVQLATITRNNNASGFGIYTLAINEAGTVSCSGGVVCSRLGFLVY